MANQRRWAKGIRTPKDISYARRRGVQPQGLKAYNDLLRVPEPINEEIRQLKRCGHSYQAIAKKLTVSFSAIRRAMRGAKPNQEPTKPRPKLNRIDLIKLSARRARAKLRAHGTEGQVGNSGLYAVGQYESEE